MDEPGAVYLPAKDVVMFATEGSSDEATMNLSVELTAEVVREAMVNNVALSTQVAVRELLYHDQDTSWWLPLD